MQDEKLTTEEQQTLLRLARQSIESAVRGHSTPRLELKSLPLRLRKDGTSFVTLTIDGELRGCIGAMEANQPLAEDVRQHAVAAAMHDFRFPPVRPDELAKIKIEISHLTPLRPLEYVDAKDLLSKLRPGIDGVMLRDGMRRATFLPQVWQKLPRPEDFLDHLCAKMGVPTDLWRNKHLDVFIYQVEEFHESSL